MVPAKRGAPYDSGKESAKRVCHGLGRPTIRADAPARIPPHPPQSRNNTPNLCPLPGDIEDLPPFFAALAWRPKNQANGTRFGEAGNPGPSKKKSREKKKKEHFICRIKHCTIQFHYHPSEEPGEPLKGAARRAAEKKAAMRKEKGEEKKKPRLKFALCALPDCGTFHFHAEEQVELYGLMRKEEASPDAEDLWVQQQSQPAETKEQEPPSAPEEETVTVSTSSSTGVAHRNRPPQPGRTHEPTRVSGTETNSDNQSTGPTAEQENDSDGTPSASEDDDDASTSSDDGQVTWRDDDMGGEGGEKQEEEVKTIPIEGYWGTIIDVPVDLNRTVLKVRLNFNTMGDATLVQQIKSAILTPFTHAHDTDVHSAYIKLDGHQRKVGRFDITFNGLKAHKGTNFTEGAYQSSGEIYIFQEIIAYLDQDSTHRLGESNGQPNINTLNHCNTTLRKMPGYGVYTLLKHYDNDTGITWHGGTIVMLTVAHWLQRHYASCLTVRAATHAAGVPKNLKLGGGKASST
jgi:hypothetical protein